ncbi:DNA topology modulation protein FlaR [Virgibacillus profundi]|uniref:DNA topology modulation protein FlaR n=1 Tax=Virgibacillus profundi TaxID=2024555 RepID=A0A2A2I8J3_9BACI|nr:AAA family ATPase [Virgibacillus profundi]PAV28029.1 DNA topology modulation protein FlaR [Virgibacillus profundi]PXY52207.1 DNA topology modulation protein FlaR [Virgibacillus profundi]
MRNRIPKRIHIIGSVGSGKTTLAKELFLKFNIPFHELDNVVWKRHKSGDIRRTVEERESHLNTIIQLDNWIIEGVHNDDWVANSFRNAELIIFLDTKYSRRTYRILKRFLLQKIGLEKSNYKPTAKIFFKMFKWNRHFEEVGKANFFEKYGVYSDKLLVVHNKNSIDNYFNKYKMEHHLKKGKNVVLNK